MSNSVEPAARGPRGALITGGARRIGAGFARHLAARGFHVVIHCAGSRAAAEETAGAIVRDGGTAHIITADLADPAAPAAVIAEAFAWVPGLNLIVNNAASFEHDRLASLERARWDRQLAINLAAPAFLIQEFAALLPPGAPGLVVNMLDFKLAGRPDPAFLSYTVAKAGLAALTELAAVALAPHIRVAGIAPGFTLPGGQQTAESFAAAYQRAPLGRGSDIADLVRALDYLIDQPAVTGTVLQVDGGAHLL